MDLYCDATALIALGAIGRIDLLRRWPGSTSISPQVRHEVRTSSAQIDLALAEGWMRVVEPDVREVNRLQAVAGLHRGEAETIEIALRVGSLDSALVIDEGRAFRYVQSLETQNVLCLPQMLHMLERHNSLSSARELMEVLIGSGHYRWARRVRNHYEIWCGREGYEPV